MRSDGIETIQYKEGKLEIFADEYPETPREWDNAGEMICFHRRYNLGDKHDFRNPEDFQESIKDIKCLIMPLYLYDHSGISISTGREYPYTDRWDSGQVGWVYITYADILKEWGNGKAKRVTKKLLQRAEACLLSEVNTYDKYLTGDVYRYSFENYLTGESDSCGGIYGEDKKTTFDTIAEYLKSCGIDLTKFTVEE